MRQLSLFSQTKTLARSGPEGVVYVKGSELFYGDTAGNEVQLTSGGAAAGGGTPGPPGPTGPTGATGPAGADASPVPVVLSLPTADVSQHGNFAIVKPLGFGERLYICLMKNDLSYVWIEITRTP
jgi:hypothetical protein